MATRFGRVVDVTPCGELRRFRVRLARLDERRRCQSITRFPSQSAGSLPAADEVGEGDPEGLGVSLELDEVEAALAAFDLADH